MIKTVNYQSIDRVALRQKGWMWFGIIIALQIVFLVLNYLVKI